MNSTEQDRQETSGSLTDTWCDGGLCAEDTARDPEALVRAFVTCSVAQEFHNLLSIILGKASIALCHLPEDDPNFENISAIQAAALRVLGLVHRAQGETRGDYGALGAVSLSETLQKVCAALPRLISSAIALEVRADANVWPVWSSPDLMEELVVNVCLGACEPVGRGGKMVLETENVTLTEDDTLFHQGSRAGDFVRLRLMDSVEGGARSPRPRQLDPQGAGAEPMVGLDTARALVRRHDGWIECGSESGDDSRLDLYLPRAAAEPHAPVAPVARRASKQTVLLVDDEPMVRELGRNILRAGGFDVVVAEDGRDAVTTFVRERDRIGLVILDLTMPRLSGDDTFQELLRIDPDVRVLFCSGYPEDNVKSLRHRQVCGFITKPYHNAELLDAVRLALP